MKKDWSSKWKSSRQSRKQRKHAANAPAHVKQKKLRAPLSKELRKQHKKRTVGVRKGDEVRVLRGDFRGKTGVVERTAKRNDSVVVSKTARQKQDGSKISVEIKASKVMITKLNLEDSKRFGGKIK